VIRITVVIAAAVSLTAGNSVATLRLEAPFDELFQATVNPDRKVDGRLTEHGATIPVKVSVRGHTSRRESECAFPKLKLVRPDGTRLKIGTHCGEETGSHLTEKYGRLPNERSPWREAAVYRILDALGVPALQAQAARVTYIYPDGHSLERNAFLVEDDDDAAMRMGGTKSLDPSEFTTADRLFATTDSARLAFGQALVGNFDWCVKFFDDDAYRCDAKNKLWNVIAVQMPDGKARPVMHDFDVSGIVTGSHRWFPSVFNVNFVESRSPREVEVIAQVQRTRSLFAREVLDATRQRFVAKKSDAYRALQDASVDTEGRTIARDYLDAFFKAIETDEQFYRPVVVSRGILPRADADAASAAVCPTLGAIPVGTPVTQPVETRNGYAKVVVLDALWHWATPKHCAPIKTGPVWIPTGAIGRDYPAR